jgi:hypothetical protein
MGPSAVISRERVFGRASGQKFCGLFAHPETEGSEEQRRECNHAATPNHMVECHLRSTLDPALGMGNSHRIPDKESPGAKGREQTDEGVAPPL